MRKNLFRIGALLAATSIVGCNNIDGAVDGTEIGKPKTLLFGEVDFNDGTALNIFMADAKFACEDLTQLWTPEEADAFPAFNGIFMTLGSTATGEFTVDADDNDDAVNGLLIRYSEGLNYSEDEDIFRTTEGFINIETWTGQKSIQGDYELMFGDLFGGESDEGTLSGSFKAEFCRNLSLYDDSATILGSF